MRVGIVAGESSGDILGAGLMRAIRARVPGVEFEGVAGPLMQAAGCRTLYPAETLAVFGITEVLRHLPRLLAVRRSLRRHFLAHPPDVFIGIDSPDFNLGLEASLHATGIRTVHYVSPSVWAWRPGRVFKVGRATDLVLALLPFEPAFYARHGFRAEFVGHPLADAIPQDIDRAAARRALRLPAGPLVAFLPGSRFGEVERLGPLFLDTACWLAMRRPDLQFVIPAATPRLKGLIETQIAASPSTLPLTVLAGRSREALQAADAVLLASGTASLEAMLCACPMVVAYRLAPLTYALVGASILRRIRHASLPNLLAERAVVPEFMQERAVPADMGAALLRLLEEPGARAAQLRDFSALAGILRRGADAHAAEAVLRLLSSVPDARG
jgi:lipid-A-disaccharide synthase